MRHYSVSNRVQDGYKTKSEFLPCPEFEMEIAKNSRETSNDDFCILGKSCVFQQIVQRTLVINGNCFSLQKLNHH